MAASRVNPHQRKKTEGLITWAGLARFAEILASLLNATKTNFAMTWHDNRAENFPCNRVYRASPANRDSK